MKRYFILLLGLLTGFTSWSQTPGPDAVFQKIEKNYRLNEDGSIDLHYYKRLKLLTHFSFNRLYGETFIVYNPEEQELIINKAQTTQADGSVVKSPENAFNEVLPRFASGAPEWNHLREMVVTHTGLEVNAVIELDYTLKTNAGYLPALMENDVLSEWSPLQEKIITVTVPKETELNYRVLNLRTAPEIGEQEGNKVYTFTFRGLSARPHGDFQPGHELHLPRLVFSTSGWEELYNYLVSGSSFELKAGPDMAEKVSEITRNKDDQTQICLDLQKIVAEHIVNYNVPFKYTGYQTMHPVETWNANGGNEPDKALLLSALIREAGIYATPVMILPSQLYEEEAGCFPAATGFIVQATPRDHQPLYLYSDQTQDQNLSHDLSQSTLIPLDPERPFATLQLQPQMNSLEFSAELKLDDSLRLSGTITTELFGKVNPYFEILSDSSYIKKLLNGGIGRGKVAETELTGRTEIRTVWQLKADPGEPIENREGYLFLELPYLNAGSFKWGMNHLASERDVPLETPYTISESYDYVIATAGRSVVSGDVTEISRSEDFGELKIIIRPADEGIEISRRLKITEKTIPVSAYSAFREMMNLWYDDHYRTVILK